MKFITLVALLFSVIAVAYAALPVEPISPFMVQEDFNQNQNNFGYHKQASATTIKSYIVVFKESAALHVIEKAERDILDLGGKISQRYNNVLKGFSALIPGPVLAALSTNPFIDYIEEDSSVGIN